MSVDVDALNDELEALDNEAAEHNQQAVDLGKQADDIGWEGEPDECKQATELYQQSWAADLESARKWSEYNGKLREFAQAGGEVSDAALAALDENDSLYAEWVQLSEACGELCEQIAPLYEEEDAEEQIDGLWEDHDAKWERINAVIKQIEKNDELIEDALGEEEDEE